MLPLRIGSFTPAAPVVLAPMAGVTNAAFRAMWKVRSLPSTTARAPTISET